MTKLKIINVGPIEWFSPHFCVSDDYFDSVIYDPFKQNISLVEFCELHKPNALFIFRGDLVRNQLYQLENIYHIEFSSEIYPTNILSRNKAEWLATKKFMHCFCNVNPYSNIFHYDLSREKFFESLGINLNYHFLPVNLSFFEHQQEKDIDILFFGRASDKRMSAFSRIKESSIKFVWIENGLDWKELSGFISRSKVVVNIIAEYIDNFEPRILLGLAGGARIITEPSVGLDLFLKSYPNISKLIKLVTPDSGSILSAYKEFCAEQDLKKNSDKIFDFLSTNHFLKKHFYLTNIN